MFCRLYWGWPVRPAEWMYSGSAHPCIMTQRSIGYRAVPAGVAKCSGRSCSGRTGWICGTDGKASIPPAATTIWHVSRQRKTHWIFTTETARRWRPVSSCHGRKSDRYTVLCACVPSIMMRSIRNSRTRPATTIWHHLRISASGRSASRTGCISGQSIRRSDDRTNPAIHPPS